MTKSWNNITAENKFDIFLIKNCNLLFPGLIKGRPSYRRSLQPSKENIQHFETWKFWTFFLFLWVIFALLDPDPNPLTRLNPDPKHWLPYLFFQLRTMALIGPVPKTAEEEEKQFDPCWHVRVGENNSKPIFACSQPRQRFLLSEMWALCHSGKIICFFTMLF